MPRYAHPEEGLSLIHILGMSRDFLTDWLTVTVAARLSELSHDQSIEKNNILEYLSLQGL